MVSTTTLLSLIFGAVLAIAFPVILLVYYRRTQKISWKAIGIGALVWFLFTQVLEKAMHLYFLQFNSTTVELFKTPIYYALYGGLAAGVFEEVGRYVGFRYWLKGRRDRRDGIAYGIGHGGFEALFVIGLAVASNLLYMSLINAGTFDSTLGGKVPAEELAQIKSHILDAGPMYFILGGLERIPAVLIHIALSLVVLQGIRTGRKAFLLYAILLHASLDAVVAYLTQVHVNLAVIEGFVAAMGVLAVVLLVKSKAWFTRGFEKRP